MLNDNNVMGMIFILIGIVLILFRRTIVNLFGPSKPIKVRVTKLIIGGAIFIIGGIVILLTKS